MRLRDILDNIYPLPAESLSLIESVAEEVAARKNEIIIKADSVCRHVYFVAEGSVRAFCIAKGREITFWIGAEGAVVLSMQSYVNGLPGYEYVAALEECRLYRIPSDTLHRLYRRDIHLANWGRKFAEKEILRAEKSLIPQLFTTARERYEALLRENPRLPERIPLEHLASYLGITPVSLSRIRGQISGQTLSAVRINIDGHTSVSEIENIIE